METIRLTDSREDLKKAASLLLSGKTVAIPTETVYGLAADATNSQAIEKIFIAKGRPQDNPLIVHISDISQLPFVVSEVSDIALKIAEKFWPGPLTLVLPRSENIPASVSAGLDTVAVRMPSNDAAREIIAQSAPLAAPSANTSGKPSPTSYIHVLEDLDGKIDAVVMSDDCRVGVESTVVSLAVNPPRLLRPGGVTFEELKVLLPDLVIDNAVLNRLEDGAEAASPGMKYKHYSPKTRVVLVRGDTKAFIDYVNQKTDCGAICFKEDTGLNCPFVTYGSGEDDASLAASVFSALREADTLGVNTVYIHAPRKTGIGLAVYNRLIRAAAFEVVEL